MAASELSASDTGLPDGGTPIPPPIARHLGLCDYADTFAAMRAFTAARGAATPDEIWLLEHPPIFTQGQAGRAEHLLAPGAIPVFASNRGGQVTYHGPGQLVVYVLLDLQRLGYGIRSLVTRLEQAMIATLAEWKIAAAARADAPGVYVTLPAEAAQRKIGSLGLRVSRGCSYHGLALNVAMDLAPFGRINPCGLEGMRMTQVSALGGPAEVERVAETLLPQLFVTLGLPQRNTAATGQAL